MIFTKGFTVSSTITFVLFLIRSMLLTASTLEVSYHCEDSSDLLFDCVACSIGDFYSSIREQPSSMFHKRIP